MGSYSVAFASHRKDQSAERSQRALTNSALMVCMRFSDSSNTFEYFDSNTSSVKIGRAHV